MKVTEFEVFMRDADAFTKAGVVFYVLVHLALIVTALLYPLLTKRRE